MSNFYFGVVEDRLDPEKMGRVKVRVYGLHSPNRSEVPTAHLPWAVVMNPTTSASMTGIGETPHLIEGTWVVVMFTDSNHQDPIILGSIPGKPGEKRSPAVGFSDPRGYYPRDSLIDQPDLPRRARGERVTEKNPSYREPADPYNATYPYNHVIQTESGHLIEYDDTPNNERINIQHRMGSFIEMHPDGSVRIRSNAQYNTALGEMVINVDGDAHISVAKNLYAQVEEDATVDIVGNATVGIGGDLVSHVKGTSTLNLHGDVALNSEGNLTIRAAGNFDMAVKGHIKMRAEQELDIGVKTTGLISSEGNMHIEAPRLDLNPAGEDPTSVEEIELSPFEYDLGDVDVTVPQNEPLYVAAELYKLEPPTTQRAVARDDDQSNEVTTATDNTIVPDPINDTTEVESADVILETSGEGSVTYVNQGAKRNLKLDPALESIIVSAANQIGVHVAIFSGGQSLGESTGYVGSHRHDDGFAADIWIYTDAERQNRIRVADGDSTTVNFITALRSAGASSIGAGAGYMGGVGIHVDIAAENVPEVTYAGYWGAGGKRSRAPSWLATIMTA